MQRTLLIALALAAALSPVALARPAPDSFQATISFDRSATAEDAYADVQRQVRRACATRGRRTLEIAAADRACASELMDAVIARASRADLAFLHMDRTGRELAAPRDMAALDR